jgi:regulator of protease activity HflC (stomatin/prohibitin superfamily)
MMINQISARAIRLGVLAGVIVTIVLMVGCPLYRVYDREMTGRAELAQASSNRQIRTLEAQAQLDAAKHLANAEIERARGVAEANRIIGDSLKGNEDYLRYLWIHNLEVAESKGATIIYVPTEANLPILEATRGLTKQP